MTLPDPLKYEMNIGLENIPIEWIPKFELYYPDLPGFPIVYVHTISKGMRIYGCPVTISFTVKNNGMCDANVTFVSNKKGVESVIRNELEERFGLSKKISLQDLIACCNGQREYEIFFEELWKYVKNVSGNYVQFGKFYEELYSIVRFVSAWNPKTGRQSEMRMLYNFLSTFGEKVKVSGRWSFVDFYLLPTYDDLMNETFGEFPKFKHLHSALEKIWPRLYNLKLEFEGGKLRAMPEGKNLGANRREFADRVTNPFRNEGLIDDGEKYVLERLVDVFNRHPGRTSYFIWSVMTPHSVDFRKWDKDFFIRFYLTSTRFKKEWGFVRRRGIGISEKVAACFLQQGFSKAEMIPIDTWVETFHNYALGINDLYKFLRNFSSLGKMERIIWLAGQSRKTNMAQFFRILWCIRYGDTGNNRFREANPIACFECELRKKCPGYSNIMNSLILIKDKHDVEIGPNKVDSHIEAKADSSDCLFICATENGVPKKIYKRGKNGSYVLIDEFSGYLLSPRYKISHDKQLMTVDEMMVLLPPFNYEDVREENIPVEG